MYLDSYIARSYARLAAVALAFSQQIVSRPTHMFHSALQTQNQEETQFLGEWFDRRVRWEWVAILFAKRQSWSPWRMSWWSLWPPEQSFRRRISNDIVRPGHPLSHLHCHTRCRPAGIRSHLERGPVPNLARGTEKVNTGDLVPDLIFDWDVRELLYSW